MKKNCYLLTLLFIYIVSFEANSQWTHLGNKKDSGRQIWQNIKIDKENNIFISYKDINYLDTKGVIVKKLNKSLNQWELVGENGVVQNGEINEYGFNLDRAGIPYIIYNITNDRSNIKVKRLTGTEWVSVGETILNDGKTEALEIYFDINNVPFIAYNKERSTTSGVKKIIKKIKETKWELVKEIDTPTWNGHVSLDFDSKNNLYVGYPDSNINSRLSVIRFDGLNWSNVGNPGISNEGPYGFQIKVDNNDIPHLTYYEYISSSKKSYGSVVKYVNSKWEHIGGNRFFEESSKLKITFDNDNDLFLTLTKSVLDNDNNSLGNIIKTYKFHQELWSEIGSREIVVNPNKRVYNEHASNIAIDDNNTPYIIFGKTDRVMEKNVILKFNDITWGPVGDSEINYGRTFNHKLRFNKNDEPIVIKSSYGYYGIDMLTYNNEEWDIKELDIGNYSNYDYGFDFAIDNDDKYYIFYSGKDNYEPKVYKNENNNWENISGNGINSNGVGRSLIELSSQGTPIIAFNELQNSGASKVMKYNGTNWEEIGDISTLAQNSNYFKITDVALDKNDVIYVSVISSSFRKMSVVRFLNDKWEFVGEQEFSERSEMFKNKLAIDNNNVPYLFYSDIVNKKNKLKKFTNGAWEEVLNQVESLSDRQLYHNIKFDSDNNIFIVSNHFNDDGSFVKVLTKKDNSEKWITIDTKQIDLHEPVEPKLEINSKDEVFVYFESRLKSSMLRVFKLDNSVLSLDEIKFEVKLTLFPNPVKYELTLSTDLLINKVEVYTITGQKVEVSYSLNKVDVSRLKTGLYFIKIYSGNKIVTKKFLKI